MTPEETAAFESFVLATGPELVRFARRLTLDHHRGEDLVQEVLARFGASWAKLAGVGDLRAYAYRAVVNEFLSWRRRRWWGEQPTGEIERGGIDRGIDRGGTAPAVDEGVLAGAAFRDALAALPPVQRAVLVLRYHLDLPDAEIAATLRCRESTVRSHARRALTTLRAVPDLRDQELRTGRSAP